MIARYLVGLLGAGAVAIALLARPESLAAPRNVDDSEQIACLALTIYYEARGETERGKLAVGHVVMNRTRSALFPGSSVCDVVRQGGEQHHRCQFTWWCDGLSDQPTDQTALRESLWLAQEIYRGCTDDPTGGALWYHSTAVKPSWSKSYGPGKRIDRHVFYRDGSNKAVPVAASASSTEQCPRGTPRTRTLIAGG